MENPWKKIPLSDYEAHMSLEHIRQLQTMEAMMAEQFRDYPAKTALVFGVAGGNGLRGAVGLERVYGVDVNPDYLEVCARRYADLGERFVPVLADVLDPDCTLPQAELAVANLFVEYVGYAAFTDALKKVSPRWVSVGIQLNEGEDFVSDSPYLHVFDGLDAVHAQMDETALTAAMAAAGFRAAGVCRWPLPNGKALARLDYERN